jgi:hypothetical protein
MRRVKTIAGLLAVFVAGLVVGGVVTVRIIQHQHRERMNSANWTPRTMTWLESKLKLSPEQQSKVQPVVERSMKKIADFRSRVEDERRQLFGEMFAEVAMLLTDDQRQQLERGIREAISKESPDTIGERTTAEP